jgi:hypothetical protein
MGSFCHIFHPVFNPSYSGILLHDELLTEDLYRNTLRTDISLLSPYLIVFSVQSVHLALVFLCFAVRLSVCRVVFKAQYRSIRASEELLRNYFPFYKKERTYFL